MLPFTSALVGVEVASLKLDYFLNNYNFMCTFLVFIHNIIY